MFSHLPKLPAALVAAAMIQSTPLFAETPQEAVDTRFAEIAAAIEAIGLKRIVAIDHARLAAAEGVSMPPARVQIFSDPAINTPLLSENIATGLDLPFKVLNYAQSGEARVIYSGAGFLKSRHELQDSPALRAFQDTLATLTGPDTVTTTPAPIAPRDYGIIKLSSTKSVPDAVASLTATVKAQSDTIWFGEIDFKAEAAALGADLPEATLLLFGGPAPGGVAMAQFPAIGLDAFCQKLLVYAAPNGGSVVLFNDIAALAKLHYGTSAPPHHALNERLTATFKAALN
ncbi:DUF302 domain-containing protein [Shimia sp. W99]